MEVRVKTIPEHYKVGQQLIIQWDITYSSLITIKISYLKYWINGRGIEIANSNTKLNAFGIALFDNKANFSITSNKIIVTIYRLEYTDHYQFTGMAICGNVGQKPLNDSTSINITIKQGTIQLIKRLFNIILKMPIV